MCSMQALGSGNQIKVKPLKNVYQIEFNGLYMGLRSLIYGPNIGEFETTMPLNRTQAQYQVDDCKIKFKVRLRSQNGTHHPCQRNQYHELWFWAQCFGRRFISKSRLRSRYNIQYFHHSPPLPFGRGGEVKKLKSLPILEYLLQAFHSLPLAQSLVHGP